jgi:hypothetical protein
MNRRAKSTIVPVILGVEESAMWKYSNGHSARISTTMSPDETEIVISSIFTNPNLYIRITYGETQHPKKWFEMQMVKRRMFRHDKIVFSRRFTFSKTKTNTIDLLLETNNINDAIHRIVYSNCMYFGIETDLTRSGKCRSKFIVSNAWQDKMIPTLVNLFVEPLDDFKHVVDHINDFIQETIAYTDPIAMPLLNAVPTSEYGSPMMFSAMPMTIAAKAKCSYFVNTNINDGTEDVLDPRDEHNDDGFDVHHNRT